MKGVGGLAAVSMSGVTVAQAEDILNDELPTDPHTRDTWRAIVDAIVPRTPELEGELGAAHVPGGLDVELEKFLIWDFNHFQEIRLETLATPLTSNTAGTDFGGFSDGDDPLGGLVDTVDEVGDATGLGDLTDPVTDGLEDVTDGLMQPELFELELDALAADSDLGALAELLGIDAVDELLGVLDDTLDGVDADEFESLLDFGSVELLDVSFVEDLEALADDEDGVAEFDVLVETPTEIVHTVVQNYPYAVVFPLVFDVVAAEFVARGDNEDALRNDSREAFPGGGTFVELSREDRLRCLWSIVDGGAIDRLDELLQPLVPDLGLLKFVVMATNGLHGFGYYTEWSGFEDTKTATPQERSMNVPEGDVQSRTQTGYPGPSDGYAADWRHAVPGGFDDPDVENLELPDDLSGDDVLDEELLAPPRGSIEERGSTPRLGDDDGLGGDLP